ncbi:spore coat protein S [Bacillus sp. JCM 19046]|uniref:Spore coat protein YutH n=1 Tax=Shouchella xiaoxiensis TaxID=766895 RepID=A0ABS2SSX3_9BACI|nr:spore coat protein YutH [Shouchella xiaoxiensis]GAF18598.1 spore coat protein S [Bacillus sp. JCM 19046]
MLERNVYDQYKLYCEERFSIGDYEGFIANNQAYLIVPKDEMQTEESVMVAFATFMRQTGDESVLELILNNTNQNSTLVDGQEVYLFRLPNWGEDRGIRIQSSWDLGNQLHTWHQKGQQGFDQWRKATISPWPTLWSTRLEQLEGWYQQVNSQGPKTGTDEAFLYTYPYFMGITENAIQYAVDTQLDVPMEPRDVGTICHRRFSEKSWMRISENGQIIKPPTSFLFDHPARDLAEWMRSKRLEQNSRNELSTFLEGYEQTQILSAYTWQLMFSRLLFPLHYFEILENYYRAQLPHEQTLFTEQFQAFLDVEKTNTTFLGEFAEEAKLSRNRSFPELDWLIGQKL